MLVLLISCTAGSDVTTDTASDERCALTAAPVEAEPGAASNRVRWTLSGDAVAVEAVARWYNGIAETTTRFTTTPSTSSGEVGFLPYLTGHDLQALHGASLTMTLTGLDAEGSARCQWEDTLPFFSLPDADGLRTPSTLSTYGAGFDAALSDTYLLQTQHVTNKNPNNHILLLNGIGDVVGVYSLSKAALEDALGEGLGPAVEGAAVHEGELWTVTAGYPALADSATCMFSMETGTLQQCSAPSVALHHGLFLSASGRQGYSSMWDEANLGLSQPVRFSLQPDGTISTPEAFFALHEHLSLVENYDNSLTLSPQGSAAQQSICSSNILTLPDGEVTEVALCYGFDGEFPDTSTVMMFANQFNIPVLSKYLTSNQIQLISLPFIDDQMSNDFIHAAKRISDEEGTTLLIYSIGNSSSARVSIYNVSGDEALPVCQARLQDDGDLFYGSLVYADTGSRIFGGYTAMDQMLLQWFSMDDCQPVAELSTSSGDATGVWMDAISASQLYASDIEHHMKLSTAD